MPKSRLRWYSASSGIPPLLTDRASGRAPQRLAVPPGRALALGRYRVLATLGVAVILQLPQHLLEDLDQMNALGVGAGAPPLVIGALVRELELVPRHRGRIVVGVQL